MLPTPALVPPETCCTDAQPAGAPAQHNVVLDRVAARVRSRIAAEQAKPGSDGHGGHAASLHATPTP